MRELMDHTSRPLLYAQANRARFVSELKEFIRFPSVSARPEHLRDAINCAQWLARHLNGIGLQHVSVIATAGRPIVYADWLHAANGPTVIVYGHYDVQPADPLDQWRSPPFEPIEHEGDVYGRGASDDKGQLFVHLKALECYLHTIKRLPVNVKCLFEGEEEIGSPNFASSVEKHRKALAADVAVVSDMPMLGPNRPAITYAMRGSVSLEVEVVGQEVDLHDGLFGGAVHNPVQGLCDILASLQTSEGQIAISGFYDRVRKVSEEERDYMAKIGQDEQILRTAGTKSWGDVDYTPYERTTILPSLTVTGITAGYQGPGPKAIIPARAMGKLSFRLVPDQNPAEIESLVRGHVAHLTPDSLHTSMKTHFAAKPVLINPAHPIIRAAAVACEKGFGTAPAFLRCGGSNPAVSVLHDMLGLPIVMMGFTLPDDHIHAPNAKFHLPNFYKGIDTSIWLLNEVRRNERRGKDGATQMYGPTQFELSRDRNHDYRLPLPCGKR